MCITNYNTYTGYSSERWCTKLLFLVNTLTVFPSFCSIECGLFAVFIKILFDNKMFLTSFCHLCACEMSVGWGHLITWMDPSVGHLNGILAPVGWNLNNNFQNSQMPGGMLKLRFDRYIIFVPFGLETSDRRKPAKCLSPRREANKTIYVFVSLLSCLAI